VTGLPNTPFGSPPAPNVFNYFHPGNRFFGTLRARLGYAADRVLFYATGGVDFTGRSSHSRTATFTNAQGVQFANFQGPNDSGVGFAVGGGVEYAWTNNWIIRGEYLFVDIDHHNVTLTDPVTPAGAGFSFSSTVGEQFSVVRGAISYKIGNVCRHPKSRCFGAAVHSVVSRDKGSAFCARFHLVINPAVCFFHSGIE
jgi:opacity protein-like surface antigen